MRLSLTGIAFPVVRRRASNSAHFKPVSASEAKQWRRPHSGVEPALQGGPLPSLRQDENPEPEFAENDSGSTAMSGSCALSHAMTRGSGAGFVGSLRTLASTRYPSWFVSRLRVDGHKEVLSRASQQPVDGALVPRSRTPDKPIIPAGQPLDVEGLPRFHAVHLAEFGRENDLAFGGYGRFNSISSYFSLGQAPKHGFSMGCAVIPQRPCSTIASQKYTRSIPQDLHSDADQEKGR